MPRNPQIVARQKLEAAHLNFTRADKARVKAQAIFYAAMVSAVESGCTRGEVAKIVGVSNARISQIPGMPSGKNTHLTNR